MKTEFWDHDCRRIAICIRLHLGGWKIQRPGFMQTKTVPKVLLKLKQFKTETNKTSWSWRHCLIWALSSAKIFLDLRVSPPGALPSRRGPKASKWCPKKELETSPNVSKPPTDWLNSMKLGQKEEVKEHENWKRTWKPCHSQTWWFPFTAALCNALWPLLFKMPKSRPGLERRSQWSQHRNHITKLYRRMWKRTDYVKRRSTYHI